MNALISGRTGRALIVDGESLASFDVGDPSILIPRHIGELPFLFGDAVNLRVIEDSDIDTIRRELQHSHDCESAMDLTLISLDPELSNEIRREAIEDLEGLLSNSVVFEYVESIFYGSPLPKSADIEGAIDCCNKAKSANTLDFLQRVKNHQPSISEVNQAWDAIPTEVFGGPEQRSQFMHQAVVEGLFRSLALMRARPITADSLFIRAGLNIQALPNYHEILRRWFEPFGAVIADQPAHLVNRNDWVGTLNALGRREAEESLKKALDEVQRLNDQLHEENIYLQEEIRVAGNFGEIIGRSEPLKRVLRQAEQVAPLDATVAIIGEIGTGKELLAHAIHKLSPRRDRTLVKVNCAALPGPIMESELFGHDKGAFTGADARRVGRFEIANGGTIFLDEISELPFDLQAKLLRVLEEGMFEPVGGNRTLRVDVRVIAATNRNLEEIVRRGTFRADLYYRLNIFPITLPPLRERREDIPILVTYLVKQLSQKLGKTIDAIPQDTMAKLRNYSWPGNVRELRNVIERAVIITQGPKLHLIDDLDTQALELELQNQTGRRDRENETVEQAEYKLILRTLKQVHWKLEGPSGAAELLNIRPSTLRSKMRRLGIERPNKPA